MHHYLWNGYAKVRHTDYYDRSVCGFLPYSFRYSEINLTVLWFTFYPFESFASVEKPHDWKKIELTLAIENGDK